MKIQVVLTAGEVASAIEAYARTHLPPADPANKDEYWARTSLVGAAAQDTLPAEITITFEKRWYRSGGEKD